MKMKTIKQIIPAVMQNAGETKSLATTSRVSSAVADCISRYKNGKEFMVLFNPHKQIAFCKNKERCFTGLAPTLNVIDNAFGERITESWLAIQIRDLSEYAGSREKLSTQQIDQIAQTIHLAFGFLKVTELMYFFFLFKSGKFGHFYGAVDGLVITESLREFMKIRNVELERIEREDRERRKAEQDEREAPFRINYEEWQELKWLFNMGYEPERIRKELEQQRQENRRIELSKREQRK